MRCLVALLFVSAALAADVLPEKFYGKFSLDHSENFDAYLEAKGYGWFTRKLVTFATFEKEFTKTADPKKFDYANLTSKKNIFYKGVTLGEEFTGEGLDSSQHKVKFYLKDGIMYEHHQPLDKNAEAKEEEYAYYFENDFLVLKMSEGSIEAKRFYKRV